MGARHTYTLGWKFLKKLWCCVGGSNEEIWLYQLSWKCKLATVTSWKADVWPKRQLFNSLRLPIYIFNLVDITKTHTFNTLETSVTRLRQKEKKWFTFLPWGYRPVGRPAEEKPCNAVASHPGGVEILLFTSCYGNWDKLWPDGRLAPTQT